MTDLCLSCIYRQETCRGGLSCALGRYHDITGWDDPTEAQRPHYPHARDVSHGTAAGTLYEAEIDRLRAIREEAMTRYGLECRGYRDEQPFGLGSSRGCSTCTHSDGTRCDCGGRDAPSEAEPLNRNCGSSGMSMYCPRETYAADLAKVKLRTLEDYA